MNDFAFKSKLFNREHGTPVVRIRDLERGYSETLYDGEIPDGYSVEDADLLVGMDGNFRCRQWQGGKAWLNQRVCKLIPDENVLLRPFLLAGVNGYLAAIQEATSSVTVGHLSSRDILRIPFPLPPLPEQRRIVAKLQALLARVDACRARLDKIPDILARFRQSVLAAACSGRLTEDWRETHDAGEWHETTLGDLAALVTSGSRGWAKYYSDSGPIFVRAQNLSSDDLDLTDTAHVHLPERIEGARTLVSTRDILVTITGANVTKTAWVKEDIGEAYVNQHVALVRLARPEFAPYCWMWAVSPAHGRQQLLDAAYGAGKPGLNLKQVRELAIQLPPVEEQREIVRRVDALFQLADAVEERYAAGKAAVDNLTQSILAKAFRGELVPQDPADEPADKLLARIRDTRRTGAGG